MKKYKHIFFDLDQTIWDFDANCSETLAFLFQEYKLDTMSGIECKEFIKTYKEVNKELWQFYNKGLVTKEILRSKRFEITFRKLGISDTIVPASLNSDFIKLCPTKKALVPYALEVLNYLHKKYTLHILTNGFEESQLTKISHSNIGGYFKEIINSERCGFLKPDKRFFNYTLTAVGAKNKDCLMIGDDLEADVLGAKHAGIDQIYLNPEKNVHKEEITLEIKCLSELLNFL